MMYDREKTFKSAVKLFKSRGFITCVSFGPYDNGHILVGSSTGDFFAFDSIFLNKLCNIKLGDSPITNITVEWTQLVLIGMSQKTEVTAITFIQTKQKYVYMEIGSKKYATVVIEQSK